MQTPSGRWSKNIALSVLGSFFCGVGLTYAGPMEDAQAAGAAAGQTVNGLYGNKDGFKANIALPLTDNTTQLKTTDGSTSFSANFSSPSSNAFLELLIQPSATGDLESVIFAIDKDMDGAVDSSYTVPRPVSGICGNGYMSCTPGTWASCTAYKWVADSTGQLSDVGAQYADMGGCYCINSSCGSNLVWTNTSIVLKDLGGGAVAAIQAANIGFMITNVSVAPLTIKYYGRLTTGAATGTTTQTTSLPSPATTQNYFNNPTTLSTDVNNIITASASDPSSLFSWLSNSPAATSSTRTVSNCTIKRNGFANTFHEDIGYDVAFYIGYDDNAHSDEECFWATQSFGCRTIYAVDTKYATCERIVLSHLTDIVHSLVPASAGQTCIQVEQKGKVYPASPHPGCYGSDDDNTHGFYRYWCYTKLPSKDGVVTSNVPLVQEARDEYAETISDTCSVYETDPNCKLQYEEVDDVVTVNNFNSTGLNGLGMCFDITGSVQTFNICKPWWEKKRTYYCENPAAYNFSDIGTRFGKVKQTLTQTGTNITFTDKTKDSTGTWTETPTAMTLITTQAGNTCEMGCKTKAPIEDNEVTTTGLSTTLRANNANAFDYYYKVCVNNACPLDKPGEVIIKNCTCDSGFNEAAAAVQAMRMAGKDTICTSGTPKPLD